MKIYKEIEINSSEFDINDLFEEIEDAISSVDLLMKEEYQNQLKSIKLEYIVKLEEIRSFIKEPSSYLNK